MFLSVGICDSWSKEKVEGEVTWVMNQHLAISI
jgi:hypothetical protein